MLYALATPGQRQSFLYRWIYMKVQRARDGCGLPMNVNFRCPKSPSAQKGKPISAKRRNQIEVNYLLHRNYKLYLQREEEKLLLAKILNIEGDFNYITYRRYMFEFFRVAELNYDRYDLVCTAVSVHLFRVLERFLSYACQLDIEYLSHVIVKGRYLLPPNDFETVINLARYAYLIEDIELEREPCLSLYESIIRSSTRLTESQKQRLIDKSRRDPVRVQIESELALIDDHTEKCYQNSPTYYINKIWDQQHDFKLISAFREKQNFNYIAKIFRDSYPDLCKFFVPEGLKNRMRRIVRGAIRKFREEIMVKYKDQLPKLLPIHDSTSKNLFRSPTCFPLQILLLNVLEDKYSLSELIELVNGINKLTEERNEKKGILKENKETSVREKAGDKGQKDKEGSQGRQDNPGDGHKDSVLSIGDKENIAQIEEKGHRAQKAQKKLADDIYSDSQ